MQVRATWPQWHGSIIPLASGRSQSCTPAGILFRLAQKPWHRTLAAQAICLCSSQLLLILPRLCACTCEASEFVVTALSPELLQKEEGQGSPCSAVPTRWYCHPGLLGSFCKVFVVLQEDLLHGNLGLWGIFSCIHVRFIVILVNCPVR